MIKKNKMTNLNKALLNLSDRVVKYKKNKDNIIYQESLIKSFELSFELGWKALREFLVEQGIDVYASPKAVFTEAFTAGYLIHEDIWLNMLNSRNAATHIYDEELASSIAEDICMIYYKELNSLLEIFKK